MQHKQQNVWRLDGNALEINHWILIPLIKLLTAAPEKSYDRSDSSDFSDLLLATVSVWLLFFFFFFFFCGENLFSSVLLGYGLQTQSRYFLWNIFLYGTFMQGEFRLLLSY